MSMADTNLQYLLDTWTRRAVGHVNRLSCPATEGHVRADVHIASCLSAISSALRTATVRVNGRCLVLILSLPVLSRICSFMSVWDTMQLSLISRSMHTTLLGIAALWNHLPLMLETRPWVPVPVNDLSLARYLERSRSEALSVRLYTIPSLFPSHAAILASQMFRIDRLGIHIGAELPILTAGSCWASSLMACLTEPAPRLTTLVLSSHIITSDSGFTADNEYAELEIGHPLFTSVAPRLHSCRLVHVRLPKHTHCDTFGNITTFSYTLANTIYSTEIARIYETMPQLLNLRLCAKHFRSSQDNGHGTEFDVTAARSLQLLMLSFSDSVDFSTLRRMIPWKQLQELWIDACLGDVDPFPELANLNGSIDDARLLFKDGFLTVSFASRAQNGTSITVSLLSSNDTRLAHVLQLCSGITRLEIPEFMCNNSVFGPSPPLPTLKTLCVHLSQGSDYSLSGGEIWWWYTWVSSGFVPDPDHRWQLPALREVHITAAQRAKDDTESTTSGENRSSSRKTPLSIALSDVAQWVREGLTFEAAKPEVIGLSGVRIIDHDFCAAWEEVMALSMSLELTDEASEAFWLEKKMHYYDYSGSMFGNWNY